MRRTAVIIFVVGLLVGVGGAAVATHVFSDVPDDSTHAEGIEWAYERGLVQGFADGTYRPAEPVSRGQFATVLFRQGAYRGPVYTLTPDCGSFEFTVADVNNRGSGEASVDFSIDGGPRMPVPGGIPAEGVNTFDAGASGVVTVFVDGIAWATAHTGETCS